MAKEGVYKDTQQKQSNLRSPPSLQSHLTALPAMHSALFNYPDFFQPETLT